MITDYMPNRSIKAPIFLLLVFLTGHINVAMANYDPSASVYRFQKQMAKRGNPASQFKLGLMYETGSGIDASLVKAITWYKKSADQQHKPAINRLTYMEIKRTGFKKRHQPWLAELKNDAKFNEGEALFLLGQMYAEGTGVDKNLNQALTLLRKAAGGNIPGSEAAIMHVEQALTELQKKPAKAKPVRKIVRIKPKKSPVLTHKNLKKMPIPRNIIKRRIVKPATKPATKAKLVFPKLVQVKRKKRPAFSAKVITPPRQAIANKESHPMDTICGGQNRFSRECR